MNFSIELVEKAPVEEIFENPLHPYTKALLSAIPVPELSSDHRAELIKGEITSSINLPDEYRFYKRCNQACEQCKNGVPPLREVTPGHFVSCCRI